jgi:acyl CoA:acetate/3-ketoacid CoA transferase
VKQISQVAFHGPSARARGQEVFYVTERAVFHLGANGLDLIETAPGIDVGKDICGQMEFQPNVDEPKTIPAECFVES